jgi:hypothetical protein
MRAFALASRCACALAYDAGATPMKRSMSSICASNIGTPVRIARPRARAVARSGVISEATTHSATRCARSI